ncbi:peptide chain release factor N(5)-glutamine methyltransferase [Deinococcus sp. AB2017081]|nr:peptide chain release factor N(5)-glutamine methyltransferase [Deinococcus sp. AB2017081]WQE97121.1 peptide chain release factor N(5)-glutamine methyltransferase [Deinococcus sp. AB2017081]
MHAMAGQLRRAGVPSPEVDARALLLHVLQLNPVHLITAPDALVPPGHADTLRHLTDRRAAREPLQYLLGTVEWGGLTLHVDPRALIPRPETEWLLHLTLRILRGVSAPRVVDVGTGSGALALGLRAARPDAHVTATDLSLDALALARENAAHTGLPITLRHADLLSGVPGPHDMVVSNPPYLPDADRDHAQPEVRHDPDHALYAGRDGLDIARRLVVQAHAHLAPGGHLALELDPRNAPTLLDDLTHSGWTAQLHTDLTGRERFITARRG